jgi:hypothetical protein
MTNEQNVYEVVRDILYMNIFNNNDIAEAAKVLAIALIRLENGSDKSAMNALDYSCEKVFENV